MVTIVGPTAAGKSRLGLGLAQRLGGEIINADSRQVYCYMDIGTGKPTPEERALVPHYLIDIVNPDEEFSLALYQERAYQAIEAVLSRGQLPILVGGTGQYIWAVVEGWRLPRVAPNWGLRQELEEKAEREGVEALYMELAERDPEAAHFIGRRNPRRIIRALEVCLTTGEPFSRLRGKEPPPYSFLILGLACPRDALYRRIDDRVEAMVARGWVEEMKGLLARGYYLGLPAMSSLGYREIGLHLEGKMGWAEALAQIKYRIHAFARRQYAWFRLGDERIHWLSASDRPFEGALRLVEEWQR